MDRAQIRAEWDKFIEYPSDDKSFVSTVSAQLFAEHIAKLQATQAEPMFWVRLRSDGGYEGPIHNAVIEDVRRMSGAWHPLYLGSEPVQAGELPALPHDGWPARFRCDSCDGNGEIGELISMGHFQPPERQTCPDCGGRGWSDEGPAFNADHMRDYARAVLSARKPLTPDERRALTDSRDIAMRNAAAARVPECGDFAAIAQDLDWLCDQFGIGLEVKP